MPEKYELYFKRSAEKELDSIPKSDLNRLLKKISNLAGNPYPEDSLKMVGVPGYRIRQGNWRVIYDVNEVERTITVRKVAHRREIYR